ncbi:hypothetical protein BpHYR1_023934 [Brachionus plicatilis]|uniref:Uncharacterized protein n=1 Tax=Brachionus plicatilis TaxID=10195 RepID=A0A3M7S609_BRAPC|nr:hypothetical protein BpHYR1_023934 [Brachionus plicatilis]
MQKNKKKKLFHFSKEKNNFPNVTQNYVMYYYFEENNPKIKIIPDYSQSNWLGQENSTIFLIDERHY